MCMFSREKQLDLANIEDQLTIVETPSTHTGNRWFQSTSCSALVCIADRTHLLVRAMRKKSLKSLAIPVNGLLRFREIRRSSAVNAVNGDFLEVDENGQKRLIRIADVPINSRFEVVSETFAAGLREADEAQIELLAEPAPRKLANLAHVVYSLVR